MPKVSWHYISRPALSLELAQSGGDRHARGAECLRSVGGKLAAQ